jgi:multimeric flavodoxin WrbA
MKILAIQGSPRPKAGSNTEILLQEFLSGVLGDNS